MYRSDPRLTFYALAPFPILAVIIYFVNTLINRKSERIQQMLSLLTANAQEAYTGIRVIKSFVQEKAMFNFFAKNSETYKNNALSLAKTEAIYFPTMGVLVGLSTLVTIYIGAMDVVNGVPGASVGKIAEFVMYIQMLSFPVSAIGWTASMTQRAATSQRRINEFLNTVPSIADTPDAKAVMLNGDIQFQHVSFQYQNTGIQALKDVSLSIRSGEKIAIVGRTGSGKTTLLQLLLRLYEADKGDIILDGLPIRMIKRSSLREGVSYVPQEVFLFSDTIYNNIIFAKPDATQHEVETAAKAAGIHDEILRFPQGYQTMVGERGVMLSGGQKQRISIARALIKSSPILIFDDSLSAVDSETENRILQTLHQYVTKRTAIIVTHRLFSLENMDRIYVMVAGEIAEAGTHVELLAKGGVYAEMYERQQNRATGKE
jgi:ATP-binding cassette subfamily B protein